MKSYKILTFDGGGIKGALSIRILQRILSKYPTLLDSIDLFAGTSTGSFIALSLASNISLDKLNSIYSYDLTKEMFSKPRLNIFRPKYSNTKLKELATELFGENTTLLDLKKKVLVPAFSVKGYTRNDSWQMVFFHNVYKNPTINSTLVDAFLASSAAPSFLPSHKGFIDGGVVANTPSTLSLVTSLSDKNLKLSIDNIKILSIGTGNGLDKIFRDTSNWGLFQWAFNPLSKGYSPLLSIVLDGMADLDSFYCTELLKDNYFRIDPNISKFVSLDSYKLVHYLRTVGDNVDLTSTFDFIENIFLK